MCLRTKLCLPIIVFSWVVSCLAEECNPVEYYRLILQARELYDQSEFEKAVEVCQRLVACSDQDTDVWELLGNGRYELGEYTSAAEAYQEAYTLGAWNPSFQSYRIARMFGMAGEQTSALSWLERAVAEGYEWRPQILEDAAFSSLSKNPRFQKIAGEPLNVTDRNEGWRIDLDHLVSEIKRLSVLYKKSALPKELEEHVQKLREQIPRLADEEILIEFQRLMVRLGDGHSYLIPWTAKRGSFTYLGLRLWFFSDGLFVIEAPEKWKKWVGSRVVKLGNTNSEDLLSKVRPLISKDNSMMVAWVAPVFLNIPEVLRYLDIISDPHKVTLVLQNPEGQRQEIILEGGPMPQFRNIPKLVPSQLPGAPPVPVYLSRLNDHYWFEHWPDLDAVYFQWNRVLNQPNESLSDFMLRLRRFITETRVSNLIVDVRNNNGGEGSLVGAVLRTLIHFETTRENGRLFVLTSRSTFSAAQLFINAVDYYTNAIFVGEPSSSKPNFIGEESPVVLPFSGARGSISSRSNQIADGMDVRSWIAPKIPVSLVSGAYFSNQDPVLDAIRDLIRNQQSQVPKNSSQQD